MTTITLEGKEYQLDIEQAEKLNLLKEKGNRVRSWEEFLDKYQNHYGYMHSDYTGKILNSAIPISTDCQLTPHEAKAIVEFSKLLKLRRDWVGEWEPDWTNNEIKYVLEASYNKNVTVSLYLSVNRPFSFPTLKIAQEFLETFRDLIEEAKILI